MIWHSYRTPNSQIENTGYRKFPFCLIRGRFLKRAYKGAFIPNKAPMSPVTLSKSGKSSAVKCSQVNAEKWDFSQVS